MYYNPRVRPLNKCKCGSLDSIIHESGGYTLIICQTCGNQIKVKGSRQDGIDEWNRRNKSE